ncbi:SCO family protein [Aquimarina sp. MMG015]|uniref:SCO family protein n=1 Tax=unclassified Aquimarina TaxID=2627091 RepID=UPI000E50951D|nr:MULTISPECIES: SCO family protein [unclassified Aquimarina]AXT57540.1 SCO family protein [Aquimarina sp. AD1]MBQ4805245.1 SCO family protein [Aquimarina sp. MMG015]RKN34294.1 SCO family protein [Aquimarina sp. AD1]
MLRFFAKYKFFAIVLFILSAIIISIIYSILKPKRILQVYEPDMVSLELVDSTVQHVRKYHKIADFNLLNQNGEKVTQSNYEDKIYVADFFFTTCQTICPIMTDHMKLIQGRLKNDPDIKLLSHTVIPETDGVPQLKEYAIRKGVDDTRWNLVTGDKKHIYDLARKSYLVAKSNGDGGPYDMIHTENFVLVDKKKRIRGFYDGTDLEEIERLLEDIEVLKNEGVK